MRDDRLFAPREIDFWWQKQKKKEFSWGLYHNKVWHKHHDDDARNRSITAIYHNDEHAQDKVVSLSLSSFDHTTKVSTIPSAIFAVPHLWFLKQNFTRGRTWQSILRQLSSYLNVFFFLRHKYTRTPQSTKCLCIWRANFSTTIQHAEAVSECAKVYMAKARQQTLVLSSHQTGGSNELTFCWVECFFMC